MEFNVEHIVALVGALGLGAIFKEHLPDKFKRDHKARQDDKAYYRGELDEAQANERRAQAKLLDSQRAEIADLKRQVDANTREIAELRAERGACFKELETARVIIKGLQAQAHAYRLCAANHGATEQELDSLTLGG